MAQDDVLEFLTKNTNKMWGTREIADAIGISRNIATKDCSKLFLKWGALIRKKSIGSSYLYTIKGNPNGNTRQ
jgi:hypothetical protein